MRTFLTLACLLCSSFCFAGKQLEELYHSVYRLDEALLQKDTVTLNRLLRDDVSYGHSNGWIERKQDVIRDLYNGKLVYKEIKQDAKPHVTFAGNAGRVVMDLSVRVLVDGKELLLKLNVLQLWLYEKKEWKLWGRQSVKIG